MAKNGWMTDLFDIQSSTIIGEINDYYLNKRFADSDEVLEPTDKVVGQLNDYEKAMFAILVRLNQQLDNGNNSATELDILFVKLQIIDTLFWSSVQLRLGLRIGLLAKIAIRKNFTAVLAEEDQRQVLFIVPDEDSPQTTQ